MLDPWDLIGLFFSPLHSQNIMHKLIRNIALTGGILFVLSVTVSGQAGKTGTAKKVLNKTAKTTIVVVGTTAKYTWKASKFTAGKVAKPIIVKSAPATGKFVLRQTGNAVKLTFPLVKRFAVTYLKLRLSP